MRAVLESSLPGLNLLRRGKVREVYDLGNELLMVASDRLSAFDVVMPNGIPGKGKVLNLLSAFWFERLARLCPHHMISVDPAVIASRLGADHPELAGRAMLVQKTEPLPVECVARGYLAGSWWKEYRAGARTILGETLPDGLVESSELPEPIFTPATKAEEGHDENISFAQCADIVGPEMATRLRDVTLAIYTEANKFAQECGLILADTKFEFGVRDGELVWIDEALTPDSSRYWESDLYAPGGPQASFDKQFVRDWLESIPWDKTAPGPELPDDVVQGTQARYAEAYHRLTGHVLDL